MKALKLTDAIYESEWYNCDEKIKKCIYFIIMRAQRKLFFTAGGLVVINRETFTQVSFIKIYFPLKCKNFYVLGFQNQCVILHNDENNATEVILCLILYISIASLL